MTDLVLKSRLEGDAKGLVGAVEASEDAIERLGGTVEKTGKEAGKAGRKIDLFGRESRQTAGEARRLNTAARSMATGLQTAQRNANLLRFALFSLATGGIARVGASFVTASSTTEQYQLRLTRLLGSVEEGNALFRDMADFAGRVPFEFEEIMGAATQLAGVLEGGREEIGQLMPLIADLAAVSGLSISETTEQIIRMFSAGAASADLFRERGILAMLGFEAGVSVSAEETKRRVVAAWEDTNSKFRGTADDLATTWNGITSMMSDKWFQFRNLVQDAGPFDFLKASFAVINDAWDDNAEEMKEVAEDIGETVVDVTKRLLLGTASAIDAFEPVVSTVSTGVGAMIDQFNRLPPWVQEVGLIGAILGGRKIRLLLAAGLLIDELADKLQEIAPLPEFEIPAPEGEGTILDNILQGSLLGRDGEGGARRGVEDFLAKVEARLDAVRTQADAIASAGAGGRGGSTGSGAGDATTELLEIQRSKVDALIDSLREEIVLLGEDEAVREQLAAVMRAQSLAMSEGNLLSLEQIDSIRALVTEKQVLIDKNEAAEESERAHADAVEEIGERLIELQPAYAQAIFEANRWRAEALAGLDETKQGYAEFADQVDQIYRQQISDAYDEALASSRRWEDGVIRGLRNYEREATDSAANAEQALTSSFRSIEDALIDVRRTGEFEIGALVDSILDEFTRLALRENILGPLAGGFEDILGGLFPDLFGRPASGPLFETARQDIAGNPDIFGAGDAAKSLAELSQSALSGSTAMLEAAASATGVAAAGTTASGVLVDELAIGAIQTALSTGLASSAADAATQSNIQLASAALEAAVALRQVAASGGGGGGGGFGGGGGIGSFFGAFAGGGGGGLGPQFTGTGLEGLLASGSFHKGGVAGDGRAPTHALPAWMIAAAPRFHAGLNPDELPAVLRRGEGVFTPRQMDNANALIAAALAAPRVEVHLHSEAAANARVEQSQSADGGTRLDVWLDETVADKVNTPGSHIGLALESRFGAQPVMPGR